MRVEVSIGDFLRAASPLNAPERVAHLLGFALTERDVVPPAREPRQPEPVAPPARPAPAPPSPPPTAPESRTPDLDVDAVAGPLALSVPTAAPLRVESAGLHIEPAPLVSAARLRRLLRRAVCTWPELGPIDATRLVLAIASGLPFRRLPRRRRASTAQGIDVLGDRGEGLAPFRDDVRQLVDLLEKWVGATRVRFLHFDGLPTRGAGLRRATARRPWDAWRPGPAQAVVITDFSAGTDADWQALTSTGRVALLSPAGSERWPSRSPVLSWDDRRSSDSWREEPIGEDEDPDDFLLRTNPPWLRLAEAVSVAVHPTAALARALRHQLFPTLSVSAEYELFRSSLVATTGLYGVTLRPEIATLLRARLGARPWAGAVRAVVRDLHRDQSGLVQAEEELVWADLVGDTPHDLLQRLLVTWREDGDRMAWWALRVLPRLPFSQQSMPEVRALGALAAAHLGTPAFVRGPVPDSVPWAWLDTREHRISLRHEGDELVVGRGGDGATIDVPFTEPVVLEVDGEVVTLARGASRTFPRRPAIIRALDGRTWSVTAAPGVDRELMGHDAQRLVSELTGVTAEKSSPIPLESLEAAVFGGGCQVFRVLGPEAELEVHLAILTRTAGFDGEHVAAELRSRAAGRATPMVLVVVGARGLRDVPSVLVGLPESELRQLLRQRPPPPHFWAWFRSRVEPGVLPRFRHVSLPPGSPLFVGHDAVIQRAVDPTARGPHANLLLLGPRLSGKTSLLNRIDFELRKRPEFVVIRGEGQGIRRSHELRLYADRAAEAIDAPRGLERAAERVRDEGRQLVLLLNEIDGLVRDDEHFFFELRALSESTGLRLLFSGYSRRGLENKASPLFHMFRAGGVYTVRSIDAPSARRIVARLEAPPWCLRWESDAARTEGTDLLLARSYCIPWFLQDLCDDLGARHASPFLDVDVVRAVAGAHSPLRTFEEVDLGALVSGRDDPSVTPCARLLLFGAVRRLYAEPGRGYQRVPMDEPPGARVFGTEDLRTWAGEVLKELPFIAAEVKRLAHHLEVFPIGTLLDGLCLTFFMDRVDGLPQKEPRYWFRDHILPNELLDPDRGGAPLAERLSESAHGLHEYLIQTARDPDAPVPHRIDTETGPIVAWSIRGERVWRFTALQAGVRRHFPPGQPFTLSVPQVTERKRRPLVVLGEVGSGMRTFAGCLLDGVTAAGGLTILIDCTIGWAGLRASLDRDLAVRAPDLAASLGGADGVHSAVSTILEAPVDVTLVLLHVEHLPAEEQAILLGRVRAYTEGRSPPRAFVVVGSTSLPQEGPYTSFAMSADIVRLPHLDESDIRALVERRLAGPIARACLDWTGGQPLLMRLFLERAASTEATAEELQEVGFWLEDHPPAATRQWQEALAFLLRRSPQARRRTEAFCAGGVISDHELSQDALDLFILGFLSRSRVTPDGSATHWGFSRIHQTMAREVLRAPDRFSS